MADAAFAEGRAFNLHTAGTDLVEGSAIAVAGATGAITIDGVTIGSVNALNVAAQGNVAHNVLDAGNPVKIGGRANTSGLPTAVADGNRVNAHFDASGRLGVFVAGQDGNALHVLNPSADARTPALGGTATSWLYAFNGITWDRMRTEAGTTGFLGVGGSVAHDAVDAGNPVKIGGKANSSVPTAVADGDRVNAWFGGEGQQVVAAYMAQTGTDGLANTQLTGPMVYSSGNLASAERVAGFAFNGTTWDRMRSEAGTTGFLGVGGSVAHDAVDAGNPVKMGGKAASAPAAVASGDRVDAWFDTRGKIGTFIGTAGSASNPAATGPVTTDNNAGQDALYVHGQNLLLNGSTWDRQRNVTGALVTGAEDFSAAVGVGPGYARKVSGTHAATGAGTAINTQGAGSVSLRLTGTFVATVQFEGSYDGTNYVTLTAYNPVSTLRATSTTGTGETWTIPVDGLRLFRTNATAYTSGTVTYSLTAQPASSSLGVASGDVAHDAVDSGNPVKIGGRASASFPAVVANGDRANAWVGTSGELVVAFGPTTNLGDTVAAGTIVSPSDLAGGQSGGLLVAGMVFNGTTWGRMRGDSTGGLWAQGAVAHDAVDAGNPVKIGGYASNAAPSVVVAGDRVNAWYSTRGAAATFLADTNGNVSSLETTGADGLNDSYSVRTSSKSQAFNGTSWDRVRTASGVTGFLGVAGPTAADAAVAAAPLTIGGRASNAAPAAMSADGDVVDARFTRTGALNVYMVDQAGAAATLGGGTQYAEDAALGVVGSATGTLSIARASAAAPTSVSADADAVGLWASRFGALNVIQRDTSGAYVAPGGGTTDSAAWTAASSSFTGVGGVFNDSAAALTSGQQGTVRLTADRRMLVVAAGDVAHDAVDSGNPVKIGGRAATTPPAAVADGDRTQAWFLPNGQQAVSLANGDDGGLVILVEAPANADNVGVASGLSVVSEGMVFNGSGWDRMRGTTSGLYVHGSVAHDAVDSGNPVKIGGRASDTTPAAVAAGDRVNAWYGLSGEQQVGVGPGFHRSIAAVNVSAAPNTASVLYVGGAGTAIIDLSGTFTGLSGAVQVSIDGGATYADAHTFQVFEVLNSRYEVAQSGIGTARRYLINTAGMTHVRYNVTALSTGTVVITALAQPFNYPLPPSNQHFTSLASAARTATTSGSDISNYWNRGAFIYLKATAITATPSVVLRVEGKDPTTNDYFTIAEFAAVTAVSNNAYLVYPGAREVPGVSVSATLPRAWRVTVVHADADSITYSVGVMGVV